MWCTVQTVTVLPPVISVTVVFCSVAVHCCVMLCLVERSFLHNTRYSAELPDTVIRELLQRLQRPIYQKSGCG